MRKPTPRTIARTILAAGIRHDRQFARQFGGRVTATAVGELATVNAPLWTLRHAEPAALHAYGRDRLMRMVESEAYGVAQRAARRGVDRRAGRFIA